MNTSNLVQRPAGARTLLANAMAVSIASLVGCSAASGASDGGALDSGAASDSSSTGSNDGGTTSETGPGPDASGGGDTATSPEASTGGDSGVTGTGDSGSSGGDGGPIVNDWSCLGNEVRSSSTLTTPFTMTFADIATRAPNGNVQVSLCPTGTVIDDCVVANPNNDVTVSGTADASGKVVLTVPFDNTDGYTGFVHVVDPSHAMLDDVIAVSFVEDLNLHLDTFTPADVTAAAGVVGAIDLTSHALIYGKVLDCLYQPAAGATVTQNSPDTGVKVFYYKGGSASATATATDASGAYLVTNAPFALFGVQTTNAATMPVGGISPQIKVGVVTTILIPPTD